MSDKQTISTKTLLTLLQTGAKAGGFRRIKFAIRLNEDDDKVDIVDGLPLTARAEHTLKQNRIMTMKDLIKHVNNSSDLNGIRNLGEKTKKQIMTMLLTLAIVRNCERGLDPLDGVQLM